MTAAPPPHGDELDLVWRALPIPAGSRLEAQRLIDWPGGPVLAAVEATGDRHLLVAVPDGFGMRLPHATRGLDVGIRRLSIPHGGERDWLDLSCHDPVHHRMFTALAGELLSAVSTVDSADPDLVAGVIERWRTFWSVPLDGLGRDEQLGLLGELWILTRWLPTVTLRAVRSWEGPLGGRHDFVSASLSVEVKTSGAATGPTVHRVQSLDQLAPPVSGALLLVSLRFAPDPLGEVTLDSVIAEARQAALGVDVAADELDQRLAAAGWSPADHGRYPRRWRLSGQHVYEVTEGFPRLTPASFAAGLPEGIVDVGYTLDMSACAAWRIEDTPTAGSRLLDLVR